LTFYPRCQLNFFYRILFIKKGFPTKIGTPFSLFKYFYNNIGILFYPRLLLQFYYTLLKILDQIKIIKDINFLSTDNFNTNKNNKNRKDVNNM